MQQFKFLSRSSTIISNTIPTSITGQMQINSITNLNIYSNHYRPSSDIFDTLLRSLTNMMKMINKPDASRTDSVDLLHSVSW